MIHDHKHLNISDYG